MEALIGPANAVRLATVTPKLAAAFLEVSQRFALAFPGCFVGVVQGYRGAAAQGQAFQNGASRADGVKTFSYHQAWPSLALDFSVLDPTAGPDPYIRDGEDARYRWVGEHFVGLGFEWGGNWHEPDWDHVNALGADLPDASSASSAELLYHAALLSSPYLTV